MKRKNPLLASLALALAVAVAAPAAIAASTVTVTVFNPTNLTTTRTTYSCENTCMVFSNGTTKWVEDSEDGAVDVIYTTTVQHESWESID